MLSASSGDTALIASNAASCGLRWKLLCEPITCTWLIASGTAGSVVGGGAVVGATVDGVTLAPGEEFNLNSTPQLREMLFERLELPVIKRTKTGPSTDASVLEELAADGHEVPRRMLEYRELAVDAFTHRRHLQPDADLRRRWSHVRDRIARGAPYVRLDPGSGAS